MVHSVLVDGNGMKNMVNGKIDYVMLNTRIREIVKIWMSEYRPHNYVELKCKTLFLVQ